MKRFSKWASENVWKTRVVIIVSHLLNVSVSILLGLMLFCFDVRLSASLMYLFTAIIVISFVFYPIIGKRKGPFSYTYQKQKALDFLLVVSGALFITVGFNQFAFSQTEEGVQLTSEMNVNVPTATFVVLKPNHSTTPDVSENKKVRPLKELRRNIKAKIKKLKKEPKGERDKAGIVVLKIFLILLILGAIGGLSWLITVAACGVLCSGGLGLSIIILIVGIAGISALGTFGMIKIGRAKFKTKQPAGEPPAE